MPDKIIDIPAELIAEARKDPFVGKRLTLDGTFPPRALTAENQVVGFHLPGTSKKYSLPYTGTIYIAKKHRGKGLATQALADFLGEHPNALSYINTKNESSRKAHINAGWEDTKRQAPGNRAATIWRKKKESAMKKTASQIADEVLHKIAGGGVMGLLKGMKRMKPMVATGKPTAFAGMKPPSSASIQKAMQSPMMGNLPRPSDYVVGESGAPSGVRLTR